MKKWMETRAVCRAARTCLERDEPCALATVIALEGSGYRRPGARLLLGAAGPLTGGVSGGCIEHDVAEHARRVMEDGRPRRLRYDTSGKDDLLWGFGLGCNGTIELLLGSCHTPEWRAFMPGLADALEGDEPFAVAMQADPEKPPRFDRVNAEGRATGLRPDGLFVDVFSPPPYLVLCGAGDDSIALVALAADMGFRVAVLDRRKAYLTSERFPGAWRLIEAEPPAALDGLPPADRSYVILKTHAYERDRDWLRYWTNTATPYIGLMGPRARREELLRDAHVRPEDRRLFGPIGLDLGAQGAEQVALSVVAEVLAVYHARRPGHLRDRSGPIHA